MQNDLPNLECQPVICDLRDCQRFSGPLWHPMTDPCAREVVTNEDVDSERKTIAGLPWICCRYRLSSDRSLLKCRPAKRIIITSRLTWSNKRRRLSKIVWRAFVSSLCLKHQRLHRPLCFVSVTRRFPPSSWTACRTACRRPWPSPARRESLPLLRCHVQPRSPAQKPSRY